MYASQSQFLIIKQLSVSDSNTNLIPGVNNSETSHTKVKTTVYKSQYFCSETY